MSSSMPQAELETVRDWAREQLKSETVPPWGQFCCMKLNETINQILHGYGQSIAMAIHPEDLPQSEERQDIAPPAEG